MGDTLQASLKDQKTVFSGEETDRAGHLPRTLDSPGTQREAEEQRRGGSPLIGDTASLKKPDMYIYRDKDT
jgi:hypothetical protein